MIRPLPSILASLLFAPLALLAAGDDDLFFESKVRPVLINRCYECHSAEKKIKGGLNLDSRAGWQEGGDNGAATKQRGQAVPCRRRD